MFPFPFFMPQSDSSSIYGILNTLGLTSNLKCAIDASKYSSGQTVVDLSGTQDFNLGATSGAESSDPGHTAGLDGYFSFDGGDFLRAQSQPAYASEFHKDNSLFSMGVVVYSPFTGVQGLVGTNANVTASHGVEFYITATDKMSIFVTNGGGTAALDITADSALTANAWQFAGITIDEAGSGFFYQNGAYNTVGASNTWVDNYSSPSSSAASNTIEIGAVGNAALPMESGSRIAMAFIFQGATLTKANFDSIYAAIKSKRPGYSLP